MSLSGTDLVKLQAHITRYGGHVCPVCKTQGWEAIGPVSMLPVAEGGDVILGGQIVPVVMLVCRTCSYAMQYAWLPIQRSISTTANVVTSAAPSGIVWDPVTNAPKVTK